MTADGSYTVFASSNFDPNEYANAILAGEPYPPTQQPTQPSKPKLASSEGSALEPAKEDISVAIYKLNNGIEDVSKQLKSVVTTHHEALLVQAAGVNELESSLGSVRNGLDEVASSLEKLRLKIRIPYQTLEGHVSRLAKLQLAADVLRRTARFVVVARRLELQMAEIQHAATEQTISQSKEKAVPNGRGSKPKPAQAGSAYEDPHEGEKERAIARAALSIAELVALLDAPTDSEVDSSSLIKSERDIGCETEDPYANAIPLRDIQAVASHIPSVDDARAKVTAEMENMVLTGLSTLNQSLLASSLQTAYNLRVLPRLVQSLVADLTDAVESRIRVAFDMARVSRDAGAKEPAPTSQGLLYRSRVRTEPTNVNLPQWTAALWTRLESLIEEMAGCCTKVYILEKVLKLKKDTVTQINFLDESMKLLENKPSATFWTVLARALEKQSREAAKASTFLQQTLSTGYPRLLRLFHEFFVKVAVHTDTTYTLDKQSPETILILRALSNFEALYLARSGNRLNEVVAQALAAGARAPPAMGEGLSIARTVTNELDAAKFDPLLVKGVAKNVQASLDLMLSRMDPLIVRDRWATNLLGPSSTPQQAQNAQLATCLYHVGAKLKKLDSEYPEGVMAILTPTIKNIYNAYERIVDPLLTAIRRELGAIIARLHRLDLGKGLDVSAGLGGPSTYMKDLVEKLAFVKTEVLSKFNVGEASREWVAVIVKDVLRSFVLHSSIAKPLGESGKLQLTSDMTELEFALGAFMVDGTQSKHGAKLEVFGDDFKALRAMRPLLFLENRMLSSPTSTAGLPALVVLHHILVRSPIPLPHTLHGWQEAEYVRWVDEHTAEEAHTLIDGGLTHWEKVSVAEGEEWEASKEYVGLARTVLSNEKSRSS